MKLKIKKTSNMLIIVLIAFVVVSTVLLYVDDKANAGKNRGNNGQYEYTEYTDTLSQNFSVIVVNTGARVDITKGEANTISHTADRANKQEVYKVQNDTLYIIRVNTRRVTISYSGEISHLILQNENSVDIAKSNFEKLDITTNGEGNRIAINNSKFATLNTKLNSTQMYFDNSSVGMFNVTLENKSQINGNSAIDTLNATVNTNSSLRLSSDHIANVAIKTDESGSYDIQQY